MSHAFKTGFSVREPMWHGLGRIADRNPNSVDELLEWTFDGDIWEPEYCGLLTTIDSGRCESREECRNAATYTVTVPNYEGERKACAIHAEVARSKGLTTQAMDTVTNEGWQAIKKSNDGHLLHVSKTSFEVFQNREAAELLVAILDETEDTDDLNVQFETGLQLKDGGMIVFLAKLQHPYEVEGDPSPIHPYASVHNYHDGTGALRVQATSIREVCWNTASAAEMQADREGTTYSFRHSRNIKENVEEAKRALFTARSETEQWVRYANELVAIPVEDEQFVEFLTDFVPMPTNPTNRVARNVENARRSIETCYHSATTSAIAGTAWGVVSAAGEFLDHKRKFRTPETYVTRTMIKPEKGKTQAMNLLADIVGYDNEELLAKATS